MTTYCNLDYETYSACDIKLGTFRYATDPSTEILMLAWCVDEGPVQLWERHVQPETPQALIDLLQDPTVVKRAFNAVFERLITKHVLGIDVPIEQWQCSQAAALSMGFPASLDGVLGAVGLGKKDPRGKRLIQMFSTPNPTSYKLPRYDCSTHPAEWQEFCQYCVRDVEVERNLWRWLNQFPRNLDWDDWHLDQRINERGMPFDVSMAEGALSLLQSEKAHIKSELHRLTGLDRITREPLMRWFAEQGVFLPDTTKTTLRDAAASDLPELPKQVMRLWTQYSTRAGDKFTTALGSLVDGRLRGVFQFRGASRTGRWAGRIIQPHNLKSTLVKREQIGSLSDLIRQSDRNRIDAEFPDHALTDLIGSSVRHAIHTDQTFAVCDWSSIESRVLGWLSSCRRIIDTFDQGLDTYKVFAAEYFKVPYEAVTKAQRQFAKPPTLGCGYRLGTEGLIKYAEGYGVELTPEESQRAVETFRTMYAEVPQLWYDLEEMAAHAVHRGRTTTKGKVTVGYHRPFMYIQLPSGRRLWYFKPGYAMAETPWGDRRETLYYYGVHQMTGQWTRIYTHGGKLVENLTQAVAADILSAGLRAVAAQWPVVLHVHDEIVVEVPRNQGDKALHHMEELMTQTPPWAPRLRLGAEGWVGDRYAKL